MTRQILPSPDNQPLSRKQRRAIVGILGSATLAEAAQVTGLSERTLSRYMAQPSFQQALAAAEQQALIEAARQLAGNAAAAVKTLLDIMQDETQPAGVRVNAARNWLAAVPDFRAHVILEKRLTELEEKLYGKKS